MNKAPSTTIKIDVSYALIARATRTSYPTYSLCWVSLSWLSARSLERALKDLRIIIITADARLAESLESQAFLVLVKPVDFGQLRDLALRLRQAIQ